MAVILAGSMIRYLHIARQSILATEEQRKKQHREDERQREEVERQQNVNQVIVSRINAPNPTNTNLGRYLLQEIEPNTMYLIVHWINSDAMKQSEETNSVISGMLTVLSLNFAFVILILIFYG